MYLSLLEIENFRGIRAARIDFTETTVLVGENDSGKSTLLEAISLVLSPMEDQTPVIFRHQDFYMHNDANGYRPAGPLNIRLTFRERTLDEWSFIRNNDFGLTLPDDKFALQELTLEVMAKPVQALETSSAKWRIRIEGKPVQEFSNDMAILNWIRRLNPVFRLKSGILSNYDEEPDPDENTREKPTASHNGNKNDNELVDKIEQAYRNLVSGATVDQNNELHDGYRAALKYLSEASDLFLHEGPPLDQIIYEILGRRSLNLHPESRKTVLRHGSAAEKIGLLLFTTAFLQSGGYMADPSAEPIIIIEAPEAHLHPMTLESVKLLIERLKWQKILTTYSGSLLSDFPLEEIRRITRNSGYIKQFWVKPGSLSKEELRRLSYHVRRRVNMATFARCWLLVEGESESWLLPYLARFCGYDLAMEGVVCVEFAQCGIAPLIKAARQLGIEWFLLSDGDAAGKSYIDTVRHFTAQFGENPEDRCLRLREKDIEHHFFFNGYSDVYIEYSGFTAPVGRNVQPRSIIGRAIHRNSKPFMAIAVIEAIARDGSPGVPFLMQKVIGKSVNLAKGILNPGNHPYSNNS